MVALQPFHDTINDVVPDGGLLGLLYLCHNIYPVLGVLLSLLHLLYDLVFLGLLDLLIVFLLLEHLGVQQPERDEGIVHEGLHDGQ